MLRARLFIFSVFFLSAFCLPAASSAEPYRIGVLTDLSGSMAFQGKQTRLGAELALDDIRKSGGELELFFGDHQLQTLSALSELQKLSSINRIQAIYVEFSHTSVAVVPVAARQGILTIYSGGAASPLKAGATVFKTYQDFVGGCRLLGNYWKSLGIKNPALLKANLEFAELCEEGFLEVYPNSIKAAFNPGDEVSTSVALLKSKSADAVLNVSFSPDQHRMLKSASSIRYTPLFGSQENGLSEETLQSFPDAASRMAMFSLPELAPDFLARIKERDPANTFEAIKPAGLAYLHVKQLYRALSKCGGNDKTCASESIASSPAEPQIGFLGFQDRVAQFSQGIYRPGSDEKLF